MQNEHPVPGVAQAAIQEGRYVGRLIVKELKGREVKRPFRYFDKGNMTVVGKNYAVLERGSLRTAGFLDLAGVGIRSRVVASAAAEQAARTAPVVVVLFHRPAQLAPHPRAALDAGHGSKVTDVTAVAH
jgi:NADH dehydrogenase FAD-containing subunit